jgi:hypothetical protein
VRTIDIADCIDCFVESPGAHDAAPCAL